MAIQNPLTGYEHKQLDNFDYSETSGANFQDESGDIGTEPSYSCDAELYDEIIGKALSSPLFIQEREEPANLRQTYHSHEESLLPAQSFFTRTSTGRPVYEPSSDLSQKTEIKSRRDQLLLQEQLSEQNLDLLEAHIKSLHEMQELKRIEGLRIDEFSRRRLIENQDTISELTARIQELQNEVNCMNNSRDFMDAESVRSGPSHVLSQPALLPPHRDPGGLLSRNNQPPDIWNSQGFSGNVFANPPRVFFVTLSRRIKSLDF